MPSSGRLVVAAGVLGLVAVVVLVRSGSAQLGFDGTVYVETNARGTQQNRVLALRYRRGRLRPVRLASYPTGGSGSADLNNRGVLDADQQLVVNARHTLLFAVNQGSDTVAAFHIASDGSLTPVSGSPFPSGGWAPASLGLAGATLIVANKAQDGVRRLSGQQASYTPFAVGSDGALQPTGSSFYVRPKSSPIQAFVAPQHGVIVSTEETGLLRTFVLTNGRLAPGSGSPWRLPHSIFPPGRLKFPVWPAGLSAHPRLALIYSGVPNLSKVVVYSYDAHGRLTFVRGLPNRGSFLPCWSAVSRNGARLYTANAGSDNITVFDIATDPRNPRQLQVLPLKGNGNPWNLGIDPSGRFLFITTPRQVREIPRGQGNTLHLLDIRADGTLREPSAPVALPVASDTNPLGLAIVPHGGRGG